MKLSAAIGGFAGACALTLLNEAILKIDRKAPRLDLLGMNAVAKVVKGTGTTPKLVKNLLPMSIAGDLISNSLYYGLALGRDMRRQWMIVAGLVAVIIAPGGAFVAKVFQGGTENQLLADLKRDFAVVRHVKPAASRSEL